ncbi:Transposase IS4 [Popillia japonica]|uniref:Transposase IS4 n=1 Tax=Popillia japonica TaxID=7064 RepID=A0AAW1MFD9_POPJA
MYMPNKPAKYGLKIQCLTDVTNSNLYNAYIYTGKDSESFGLGGEEKKFLKPTQAVLRQAKPLFNSCRNITTDNWYSSIQLVDVLGNNNWTYVGTVKKQNKAKIPPSFQPNKKRVENSTLYGFRKNANFLRWESWKTGMHNRRFNDPNNKKPEIISYYNENKGGVDSLDEKCSKTPRVAALDVIFVIFFRLLDISVVNSYILHQCYKNNPIIKEKSVFGMRLAMQLVEDHMRRRRRLTMTVIPRELRTTIGRILGVPDPQEEAGKDDLILEKRKICHLCPSKKRRMTKYLCLSCKKPVCLQCTKPVCNNCAQK